MFQVKYMTFREPFLDFCLRLYESNRNQLSGLPSVPLPYTFYGGFKMFKISASEFGTVGMRRQMQACTDEFLATVN